MFKYLNPRRFYYAVGRKKFLEFILLAIFILFFYGPLMYMCIMAFGNTYEVPNILPQEWGFKWWEFVFSQQSLVSSIVQSLVIAVITTVCSMVLCIPAAYSLARFRFPGSHPHLFRLGKGIALPVPADQCNPAVILLQFLSL